MRKMIFCVGLLGVLLSWASVVLAQTAPASDYERALVQRELERLVARERSNDVTVVLNNARSYPIGNNETGVRGRAVATDRRGRSEEVWYDFVIDTRRNRVTRTEWGFGTRRDGRDDYDTGRYQPGGVFDRPASGPVRNGRYEIELVATRRLLDAGSGGTVVQSSARGGRSQQWDIEDAGNGLYYVRSAATGEYMSVSGDGDSGSTVVLSNARRGTEQLWEIKSGPDNGYHFISRRDKWLDSPSSARHDGGRMQVYSGNGEANQRFLLRLIDGGARYDDRYNDRFNDRYRDRPYRDDVGPGRMTWSGRVDDVIELEIRGNSVRDRLISGQPVYDARANFSSSLPRREVNVRVERLRGRGRVDVIEQPSSRNGYTALIQIRDSDGGADNYEIEVSWN